MALLEWKDSFSVSIPKFDDQHKKLISLINDLHAAMGAGKGKEVLGKIFAELIEYTKSHFADEEAEFKKYNYPETFFHQKEHEKLTNDVVKYYNEFTAGKATISIEIMNFLKNWLQNHIMGTDKKYSSYLKAKGVK
jgi:hemerythrin